MNRDQRREQRIKKYMSKCKYFNGVQHSDCKAGIRYDDLPRENGRRLLPCLGDCPASNCRKHELTTREEAESRADAVETSIARSVAGLNAVCEDAEKQGFSKGNGGEGSVECPICNGTIRYTVSGYNGHRHAACSTDGCVAFIE